jgi:hypothetical protein
MQSQVSANHREVDGAKSLPGFALWRQRVAAAEQGVGWLDQCDDAGRYLAVSRELVTALSGILRRLAAGGRALEVCAGTGQLASCLSNGGIPVLATDVNASDDSTVLRMSAESALQQFRPTVVLGAFVPLDAGVDEAVLAFPTVQHYVVLNARVGGSLGASTLWQAAEWRAEPLTEVGRWMITRHDIWLGSGERTLLQHGEAWHFARRDVTPESG